MSSWVLYKQKQKIIPKGDIVRGLLYGHFSTIWSLFRPCYKTALLFWVPNSC